MSLPLYFLGAVMARTALTLVLALLLAAVATIQIVEVAKANPVALSWLPTRPDVSQPEIVVQSPSQNQQFTLDGVSLNFTVVKPESWFGNETLSGSTSPVAYYSNGEIVTVQYTLNGKSENVSVNDDKVLKEYKLPLQRTLSYSLNLSLPEGKYVLDVHVAALAYYMPTDNWDANLHGGVISCETNEVAADSTQLTFYVTDTDKPAFELSPLTLVVASAVAFAVAGAGLLVYFKKRKR